MSEREKALRSAKYLVDHFPEDGARVVYRAHDGVWLVGRKRYVDQQGYYYNKEDVFYPAEHVRRKRRPDG